MIPTIPHSSVRKSARQKRGFTLVEIITSIALAALIMTAVAMIVVMSAKIIEKNKRADAAATQTRLFQERLNKEISLAVADPPQVDITKLVGPIYKGASATVPVRYNRLTYRIVVGLIAKVRTTAASGGTQVILTCPPDFEAAAGDYLMCDSPDLGSGALIDHVDDGTPAGSRPDLRDVTLTLHNTIASYTLGTVSDMEGGGDAVRVSIHRQRAFQVEPSALHPLLDGSGNPLMYELRWYKTTARTDPPPIGDTEPFDLLSSNLAPSARYPFIKIPDDPLAKEPAVGWQFTYAASESALGGGGKTQFYQANHSEGLIMPRSGSPMPSASLRAESSSTVTTSTSTTSSTSTTTSTSTSSTSTTTSSTSTSSKSTTSTSTSTSTKSTTSTSTSKTSTSTMSTTSTSTSSTSKTTTSTSTSTSTKSTTSTSTSTTTTSKTTTSTMSTTSTSSTSTTSTSTTTKSSTSTSTSTTSKTTTSTSTSTKTTTSTSTSTSTTSKTTTSTSTSSTTSTTTSTTSSTSTTTMSTTSTSTSTTTKTTTSTSTTSSSTSKSTTSTTTSIEFDG